MTTLIRTTKGWPEEDGAELPAADPADDLLKEDAGWPADDKAGDLAATGWGTSVRVCQMAELDKGEPTMFRPPSMVVRPSSRTIKATMG